MPKPHPKEFRDDAIAVARKGEAPLGQIAKDFGISESCLRTWLVKAERAEAPAGDNPSADELRKANKRIRLLEQENEVLRRAAAYLARDINPFRMFPLVRDMAQAKGTTPETKRATTRAPQHGAIRVPVVVSCRVLGFSRQAYYQWLSCPVSQRDWDDAHLINAAVDLHTEDPGLGYRLIADELPEVGITAGENRVHRLCKQQRIRSFHSVRNGSWKKPGPAVHDDLVARTFHATGANRVWLTDITEHPTGEGKLYLCAVKDVFSNRIVGYSIDTRMKKRIAINALRMAVQRRGAVRGCIVHSDRGSQFRSDAYVAEWTLTS